MGGSRGQRLNIIGRRGVYQRERDKVVGRGTQPKGLDLLEPPE